MISWASVNSGLEQVEARLGCPVRVGAQLVDPQQFAGGEEVIAE